MRDVSHQAAGAQALGLARYTHNMLRRFAENISSSRDWCSYWEIDRLNRPAPMDYVNDRVFWYNLPANFDVLDTCYRMYLWSGDRSYIEDPVFLNFYHHTVTDYVLRWNLDLAHVMTRETAPQDPSHFRGDPSYGESRRDIALGEPAEQDAGLGIALEVAIGVLAKASGRRHQIVEIQPESVGDCPENRLRRDSAVVLNVAQVRR